MRRASLSKTHPPPNLKQARPMIRLLKYLMEWVLTLLGWGLLSTAFVAVEEVSSDYGDAAGAALTWACIGAAAALFWKTLNLLGMRSLALTVFEWATTLFAWGLFILGSSHLEDVSERFGSLAGKTLTAALIIMFIVLVWKTFSLMSDDDDAGSEVGGGGSNINAPEKSSALKKAAVAGIAAKTYQNVLRKPTVIPPPGWVIKGLKQKGFGSTWEVRYGTAERLNITNTTKINKRTRGFSHGAAQFKVEWP